MIARANFSAFRSDGTKVSLQYLLSEVPHNDLNWSVLAFRGVGTAPDGLTMEQFERLAESTPGGYLMSWQNLKEFSGHLDDTIDCLIVAAKSKADLLAIDRSSENLGTCDVWLELDDSTDWYVQTRKSNWFANIEKLFKAG